MIWGVVIVEQPRDLDKFLKAFLALDRAVVEFYMQIYRTPPDQQFAILVQNQCVHSVVKERVPELLFGGSQTQKGWRAKVQRQRVA